MASVEYATINVDKTLHQRIKISAALAKKPINDYLENILDEKLVKLETIK